MIATNNLEENSNQSEDVSKNPKEKVEFIVSEFNSIISSQLESQRFYYLELMKRIEQSSQEEKIKLEKDLLETKVILINLDKELETWKENKNSLMENVKKREKELKTLEEIKKESEHVYQDLIYKKKSYEGKVEFINKEYKEKVSKIDNEIEELNNQIKDLKVHLNT
jgi:BRCA1-associated protein